MIYNKPWLNQLIAEWRKASIQRERLEARIEADGEARHLLSLRAGHMTEEEARYLFKLVTRDFKNGSTRQDRFAMGFTGNIVHQLVSNMDKFNEWMAQLWSTPDVPNTLRTFWQQPLLGAGTSFPSLILYLRDPSQYNLWMGATDDGLKMLGVPPVGADLAGQYLHFNAQVNILRREHGLAAEETDIILTRLSRKFHDMADKIETALRDVGLRHSKTAIRKRIKPEFGLSWDVGVNTPGVPVRWVAGSRVRGQDEFVLHALVGASSAEAPALRERLIKLGYQTWLCDGADPATNPEFCDYHSATGANTPYHVVLGKVPLEPFSAKPIRDALRTLIDALRDHGPLEPELDLVPPMPDDIPDDGEETPDPESYGLADAAADTFLPEDYLQELLDLMETTGRRQMILFGPPGTGKTFVARALARLVVGTRCEVPTVQFHPSYAYEEFMEGLRPQTVQVGDRFDLTYQVEAGLFQRFCATAAAQPARPHVLIIDEINRGNIPRIFGELLYLLEYRDSSVTLPYSKKAFAIPPNVYIIGTMNTADRSIALVDAALRRRFHFIPFFPDTQAGILRSWLREKCPDMEFVADMVDNVNALIGDRSAHIGHSYFMQTELDQKRLRLIWTYNILPLLEEQFFDQPQKLAACQFDRRLKSCEAGEEDGSGDGVPD